MTAHLLANNIDDIQRSPSSPSPFRRFLVDEFLSDVYREELSSQAAGFHPSEVGVRFYFRGGIIALHSEIEAFVNQRRSDVVVSVDHDRMTMKLLGSRSNRGIIRTRWLGRLLFIAI